MQHGFKLEIEYIDNKEPAKQVHLIKVIHSISPPLTILIVTYADYKTSLDKVKENVCFFELSKDLIEGHLAQCNACIQPLTLISVL